MTSRKLSDLEFVVHWPDGPAHEDAERLVRFWLDEQALPTEADARKRLGEVVLHAQDRDGGIAAVCTAVPMILPRLGEPMYYYRAMTGREWRSTALVKILLMRGMVVLEKYAVANAYPCIGIVLELENQGFAKFQHGLAEWRAAEKRGFVYIGKSRDGYDLRINYFPGARLTRGGTSIR